MRFAKNTNNELVDIAFAISGTDYYCIDCGRAMFPKNLKIENRKKEIHFSHYTDCPGSLETYLHKLAKLIIEQERRINLPRIGEVRIESSIVEKQLGNFIPDILLKDEKGGSIIIEIFVTHRTGPEKINKIKSIGLPAFEIDLSSLSYGTVLETIKFELIENLRYKKELNPPLGQTKGRNYLKITEVVVLAIFAWIIYKLTRMAKVNTKAAEQSPK